MYRSIPFFCNSRTLSAQLSSIMPDYITQKVSRPIAGLRHSEAISPFCHHKPFYREVLRATYRGALTAFGSLSLTVQHVCVKNIRSQGTRMWEYVCLYHPGVCVADDRTTGVRVLGLAPQFESVKRPLSHERPLQLVTPSSNHCNPQYRFGSKMRRSPLWGGK